MSAPTRASALAEFAPMTPAFARPSLWLGLGLYLAGELLEKGREALESADGPLDMVERTRDVLEAVGL